jgi:hypothetical protein
MIECPVLHHQHKDMFDVLQAHNWRDDCNAESSDMPPKTASKGISGRISPSSSF